MRKFSRALVVVALLSPGPALAQETPVTPTDNPALAAWQEFVEAAPKGALAFEEAAPLGDGGIEVKGLSIKVDPMGGDEARVTMKRLAIASIQPLGQMEGPPEQLDLRIEGMVLTSENSGLDPELFAALEASQITVNLTLNYLYLPRGGFLALQDLTIDLPFLATASLSLDAAGVNLGRAILDSRQASEGVMLREARLTFEDNSLLARLLRFEAKRDGVSFEEAQNASLRELTEELNWLDVARGGRIWTLAESLGGLLIDAGATKGPLTVTLRPQTAVALNELFKEHGPEDIARILNLQSSYAGSRAQFASTESDTPGRPDLTLTSDKTVYKEGETVVVSYAGLPGNQRDWVTVVPLGAPADNWGQWTYTDGKTEGTFEVSDLAPGSYEARVYLDWPRGGFDVVRRWYFSVEP